MTRDSKFSVSSVPERLLDAVEAPEEVSSFVERAKGIYALVKRRRVEAFFKAIDFELARGGSEAKARFQRLLGSAEGEELLADFVEAAARKHSRLASAGLAVLYTDVEGVHYSAYTKNKACQALDGLTDEAAQIFLLLTDVVPQDELPDGLGPFKAYSYDKILARKSNEVMQAVSSLSEQIGLVADLQVRGLLHREHGSRFGGAAGTGVTYGVSEFTNLVRHILLRGQAFLNHDGAGET